MKSDELRKVFLDFFEKKGHKIVPSSSLLPADPSVLFTSAGMQQFKEYYLEKPSPFGKRVVSCQKCFRTSDIEEVGDTSHLTFLEMLGNFSFADYFKKETIELAFELLTKEFKIPREKLWITFFEGDKEVPADINSKKIWQNLGIPADRIFGCDREENFWGPTGEEGPCGPTTEIHYDNSGKPCEKGKSCVPNCECGRFVELWNLVFNEYYQNKNKKLTFLKQKGVDTGMGLERLAMVCQGKFSVFETDLFQTLIKEIEKSCTKTYSQNPTPYRIIADHIKGAVFLAAEGILPSNVEQGYVLRRILRRAIRFGKLLAQPSEALRAGFLIPLAKEVIEIYQDTYPEVQSKQAEILTVIQKEEEKFAKSLEKGYKVRQKLLKEKQVKKHPLTADETFHLYDTHSVPVDDTLELAKEYGVRREDGFEEKLRRAFEKHQEISRAGVEKKFGGVGKEATYEATKLHTATHLLHQALREVLGEHVQQMGSDITPQRLRFDFSHSQKMTTEEIKKVEDLVNQKIKEDLEVKKEEMFYKEALRSGALSFFKEKYPEKVIVYSITELPKEAKVKKRTKSSSPKVFSKEICAGPHVKRTSELGSFKITKEESSSAGVRRIRAILE